MTDVPHRKKALPLTQSILWVPSGATTAGAPDAYHLFMHQRALHALHDHLRSSPDQGVLGFLLGHLYQDPQTSQRFAVIELVMRLTVAIYGDKTTVVVSRVWDKMQEELTRTGAQLLGWYHSHPPGGPEMAAGDLETHATYFGEPWHAALVLGSDDRGPWAALYRPYRSGPEVGPPLAFYELLDPRSVTPDGKKRSSVRWMNYKPQKPSPNVSTGRSGPVPAVNVPEATPAPAPAPLTFTPAQRPAQAPPPEAPPRSLANEQVPVGFVDAKPAAAPPPPPPPLPPRPPAAPPARRPRTSRPRFVLDTESKSGSRFPLVAGLLAVVLLGGGAAWYFLAGPGAPGQSAAEPAAAAPVIDSTVRDTALRLDSGLADSAQGMMSSESVTAAVPSVATLDVPPPTAPAAETLSRTAVAAFDRVTDTLVAAIQSYQERARGYDARPDCGMLSRGLVQVERAWVAYNTEKRTLTAQLDGDRTRRDLMLYSNVDTVQAHYDRTTCRRP